MERHNFADLISKAKERRQRVSGIDRSRTLVLGEPIESDAEGSGSASSASPAAGGRNYVEQSLYLF